MSKMKRLSAAYKKAHRLNISNSSRIIFFSDCHRGDKSSADDFAHNENIYLYALRQYFKEGYTYIELGDGDELWENKDFEIIYENHRQVYDLIRQFAAKNRFNMIHGNHDYEWTRKDKQEQFSRLLSFQISVHESILLVYNGREIFCVHGHQVDGASSRLWKVSRFFVRYVWKRLQKIGVNDMTSPAQNNYKRDKIEKKLQEWGRVNDIFILAGHTHKPRFIEKKEDRYLNTGSCVHPYCISGIEISQGFLFPVKWHIVADEHGILRIKKQSGNHIEMSLLSAQN